MQIARRFEVLLDAYQRPDGRPWTGQEIDKATGSVVTRSYVTNLRKGRILNPGYEKLRAIARALNFPPELWFEEYLEPDDQAKMESGRDPVGLDKKVSHLFENIIRDDEGKHFTDAEGR